jgi:3-methylcrotonyl-CoA carboxylase alpha subunit
MPKVLIANRGEIACRIIRGCRRLGYSSVAVYSEADADAQHVRQADEAYPIGPAPVRESYLKVEAIIEAALSSGARFVHPGYGLLSENAGFAEAVEAAGLIWVGPAPTSIIAMGDKGRARDLAIAADVPVLPGSPRLDLTDEAGIAGAGDQVGFPLLVKASGGGGGIGMRLVEKAEDLAKSVKAVSALAERTFGDGGVFLERHVARARHIEVQIFGLGDGRVFHLFDRECSIQRRFQKVIEEAPAPRMADTTRAAMTEAACRLAASQNYAGAGTIEFIVDDQGGVDDEGGGFYFLEMNTRIQVEHPVTEMITGQDIVGLQLSLAAGDSLDRIAGISPQMSGHSIECRLYAENPAKKFFPSPGTLERFELPEESEGLRIDAGFVEGDTVTPFYDPMIAKIITAGINREAAVAAMAAALDRVDVGGIVTNLAFLKRVIGHPEFIAAKVDTRFIDRHGPALTVD